MDFDVAMVGYERLKFRGGRDWLVSYFNPLTVLYW